jgi:hypothetical protein
MMKDNLVLAVICLIVVGGVFAWWQTSPHSLSATGPSVRQSEPAPPPAPAAKPVVRPKPAPVAEAPAVVEVPVIVAAIPVDPHDPPPFPAVEQISTGVREDSVTGTYGDPALSTVTSSEGHMVETFVYARGRGQSATIIRLQDGKVAAAYSQSEPVLPPGLSAPRRWHNQ